MGEHQKQNLVTFPRSQKERRRILRESNDSRLRRCAALRTACGWLLVISCFLFLLANYRLLTPSSIRTVTGYALAGLRHQTGDASTIAYENGSFSDAALFGGGLAYVDGDTLYLARPGGQVTQKRQLAFSSVAVEAGDEYVLAYDRGGHGATILNTLAPTAEMTLSSPIITGAISEKGDAVLVTDEQGYRTAATIYNTRGTEVFKWQSSEYYILSAALSPDGKTLAALAFRQNGLTLDSHVLFFSVDKGEQIADATLSGALGLQLTYLSGGNVAALCDNGLFVIDRKGEVTTALSYSSGDLLTFAAGNRSLAVATRSYSGAARSDVYVLRSNGKLSEPVAVTEEPAGLALSSAGVAVMTATGVSVYDSGLAPRWTNPETVGARRVLLTDDGTVFVLYAKSARLFTAHSEESGELVPS